MTKTVLAIHGPDHSLGGPDPFRAELPFIYGHNDGATQSVTDDEELQFSTSTGHVITNDIDTFAFDPDDPGGLVIVRSGIYRFWAAAFYSSSDLADAREMYVTCQLLANGPLAGLGAAVGDGGLFELGPGQNQSSVSLVTATNTIAKSALAYIAQAQITATEDDPMRAAVILQHNTGVDYMLSTLRSSLLVERVSGRGGTPPLPPGVTP